MTKTFAVTGFRGWGGIAVLVEREDVGILRVPAVLAARVFVMSTLS